MYRDYQINIYRDDDSENPRDMWDHSSHFWCNHRHYSFGSDDSKMEEIVDDYKNTLSKDFQHDYIYVPVYMYDHSGQTVKTTPFGGSDGYWDSGLFGILAESKAQVKKEYGCKIVSKKLREKIVSRLTAEVKEFDQWLTGEVYGYEITREDDDEVVDSCWGFYGDYNDREQSNLLDDAISTIDWRVNRDNEIAEQERIAAEMRSCEFWSGENAA